MLFHELRKIDREFLICAFRADVPGVLERVKLGADANVIDPDTGDTAMHVAAEMSCAALAHALITTGQVTSSLDIRNDWGSRPIDIARGRWNASLKQDDPVAIAIQKAAEDTVKVLKTQMQKVARHRRSQSFAP